MKMIYLTMLIFLFGCASFVDTSSKKLIKPTDEKLELKVTLYSIDSKKKLVKFPKLLVDQINSVNGCDLSASGKLMQEEARLDTSYAFRFLCELIVNLKNNGFKKVIFVTNNSDFKSSNYLNLNIEINHNQSFGKKAWQTVNIITLGLLPYWNTKNYLVKGKFSKGSREFSISHSFSEVRQLFLLPAMPFLDGLNSATNKVHKEIANKIINEINGG
ncbi:hypothetical protein [Halobacteriovorax sp. DPLXC-1]|uniref:hypothetical protein n=1 Tax=Halobacteriovorax sp. DPLXC-1 TaxID=3110771 RepID=UPI002FF23CA6